MRSEGETMRDVSEHIERLITRKLDGEITVDEALELDRELIRSPQARALFDECRRLDQLAAACIKSSVGHRSDDAPVLVIGGPAVKSPVGHRRHAWIWAAAAMAACLALVVIWNTPNGNESADRLAERRIESAVPQFTGQHGPRPQVGMPRVGVPGNDVGVYRTADTLPPPVDRVTDVGMILVPAADGNYFMLPVEHTREFIQRNNQGTWKTTKDPI